MSKKIIRFVKSEIIYGGHLLAMGAVGLIISFSLLLHKCFTWDYLMIVYLIVYNSYLFNRYKEREIDKLTNPERTRHFSKYALYTPLISGCVFLIILAILYHIGKLDFLPWAGFLFLGGMIYTLWLKRLTVHIPVFKNLVVALEWILAFILLPIYYPFFSFSLPFIILVGIIYLKVFILTSYFDVKDVQTDENFKLLTLPVIFHLKTSLWLLRILTVIFGIVITYSVYQEIIPSAALFLLLTLVFNWFIFRETEKERTSFSFLYFLASLEFIFWPILILMGFWLL